ncbi:MAG: PorP/SprF family type IX secretion system membrane protein [Bacteroidales bacterium]|nr:PorP/SprF family type IX secretion system membrane protein [Bacteroidales bacterium]
MKRIIHIAFFLLITLTGLKAQNYPVYSQYLLDGLVINPAYTGTREALALSLSFRKKSMNFDGAPSMGTFSMHSPLKNDRIALGMMAHYQTYGVTSKASIFAQYAFHIKTNRGRWSLGLKAGADMVNNDYYNVTTVDPDPAFTGAVSSYTLPNVGVGVYYSSQLFFAGLAVPELFSYREKSSNSGYEIYHDYENYYFMGTAGGLFTFTRGLKFKPSTLVRYSLNNPLMIDLNGNFIISDFLWLGFSWRLGEEVLVGIVEFQINQQLRLGYAYEYNLGNISTFVGGTHEIALLFEFGKTVSAANPRYF